MVSEAVTIGHQSDPKIRSEIMLHNDRLNGSCIKIMLYAPLNDPVMAKDLHHLLRSFASSVDTDVYFFERYEFYSKFQK